MSDSEYTAYEQQNYVCALTQSVPEVYQDAQNQLAYTSDEYCHPHPVYNMAQTPLSEIDNGKTPLVTGWDPEEGRDGTRVIIHIRSNHELALSSITRASVSFANRNCPAQLTSIGLTSAHTYAVTSEAPPFAATQSVVPEVLVRVRLQNDSQMTVGTIDVGYFRYNSQQQSAIASTQAMLRMQNSSTGSSATCGSTSERAVAQQLSPSYRMSPCRTSTPSYAQRSRPGTQASSPRYAPYEMTQTSFRRRSSTVSTDTTNSSVPLTPRDPGWASSYTAINGLRRKTGLSSTSPSRGPLIPNMRVSTPKLIRTTELVKMLNMKRHGSAPDTSPGVGSLNPHSENSKHPAANLIINGCLDTMTLKENWTPEEKTAKRRLVQFKRSQSGSTVTTSFAPVETCVKKSGIISCILWDERCVVTSVDTIRLIEFLVASQTDVNEKNRIRRNVEKFQPTTIHKDAPETGALFRLIMEFVDPKPRNIAKPVKVFLWHILATAITKVIEKYSPDYYGATDYLHPDPGPTSQPKTLLKNEMTDDANSNESNPPSPHSTSNSTHSRSQSSTCSASGTSWASPTTSPNSPHTVCGSQTSEPMPPYFMGAAAGPIEYASPMCSYLQTGALGDGLATHVSMAAGYPVRGSWDFSGVGPAIQGIYDIEAARKALMAHHSGSR
ncbi:MAG: hypothetical protein Q9171_002818 [Xanthocarpia ochracea]